QPGPAGRRAGPDDEDRCLRRPPRTAPGRPQRGATDQGAVPHLRRESPGQGDVRLRGQVAGRGTVSGDGGGAGPTVPAARARALLRGRGVPGVRLAPPHAEVPGRRAQGAGTPKVGPVSAPAAVPAGSGSAPVPVTVPSLRTRKRRRGDPPIVMVTAYDEPGAR